MNVLHIEEVNGWRVLAPRGDFADLSNRYRDILVVDEDNPYGEHLYIGPAWRVSEDLDIGRYWFEWGDYVIG